MNPKTQEELVRFYVNLAKNTAKGIQKKVCEKNSIPLSPNNPSELCPIPVYEEEFDASFLKSAQSLRATRIYWATNPQFEFLPAYFKKKRINGRLCVEIVVVTENYCEARFFAAKELMHCFLDDDGIAASNSVPMVSELLESLAIDPRGLYKFTPQTIVDEVAWLGAAEYLVPNDWIPLLVKLYEDICVKEPDSASNAYLHLAQLIRVPEAVLRSRLRDVARAA